MSSIRCWQWTFRVLMSFCVMAGMTGCGGQLVETGTSTRSGRTARSTATDAASASSDLASLPHVLASRVISNLPESKPARYHEVQAGETLSRVAKRYGLTAKQVGDANGLAVGGVLTPGQLLHIPR